MVGGGLPGGLTLNPNTGEISGTPNGDGPFTFTIQATAVGGCAGTITYTMTTWAQQSVCGQSFDGVIQPNLPVSWVSTATGGLSPWVTTVVNSDAGANTAQAGSATTIGTTQLVTPNYSVAPTAQQMRFRTAFNLEDEGVGSTIGRDGMVLEISINGGAFQDIIDAGGSFVTGGYNKAISMSFGSPLSGRMAWSGLSNGTTSNPAYITTTVNMPPASYNQLVRMRWVVATDSANSASGDAGVRVDTILGTACTATAAAVSVSGRVMNPYNQGLVNAIVTLADETGAIRTARTSSFGYYTFDGVPAGRTYIARVDSRRYTFDAQVVQVFDNLTDVDFVGRE